MDTLQQKQYKILAIGDSCTDIYHYGTCDRISPEAPVPILKMLYSEEKPGMVLNVVENLKALGNLVDLITNQEQLIKERYVDKNTYQHMLRVDIGEQQKVLPLLEGQIGNIDIDKYDAIVVSDYNKGFINSENIRLLIKSAKGLPIFVDSKKRDLSIYEGCFIKINQREYENMEKCPEKCKLIVTLGEQGALYKNTIYPVDSVDVFDVCGAGDSFLAGLVTTYLRTNDISESIKVANKCASVAVKRFGTYAVRMEDIK